MLTYEQNQKLRKEVKESLLLIEKEDLGFGFLKSVSGDNQFVEEDKYSGMYTTATEDIRGYIKEFGTPETALTITGSGDQVLNLVNIGAKEIDAFDINPLAKRACALRVAAVKTLDQSVFHAYYRTFAANLFAQIATNLSEEDYAYWNAIYDLLDQEDIKKRLFPYFRLEKNDVKQVNPYMDKENYINLQQQLNDVTINYIDSDIYNIKSCIGNKKYDAMNFSNTYEYLNFGKATSQELAKKYYDFIINEMYPRLNEGGNIMVTYMYAFSPKLKEEFDKMLESGASPIPSGAISYEQLEKYMKGFTSQNLSYSMLLDEFKNDQLKIVQTEHVRFGQSMDMSHDMALCLKK